MDRYDDGDRPPSPHDGASSGGCLLDALTLFFIVIRTLPLGLLLAFSTSWVGRNVVVVVWLVVTLAAVFLRRSLVVRLVTSDVYADRALPDDLTAAIRAMGAAAGVEVLGAYEGIPGKSRGGAGEDERAWGAVWVHAGRRRGAIFVGENLVADRRVLRAVAAHEIGHARYNHVARINDVTLLISLLMIALVASVLGSSVVLVLAVTTGASIAGALIIGAVRRRFEYAADRYSASVVGADAAVESLTQYKEFGIGVDLPGTADNIFGTHPSMERRIQRLHNQRHLR